MQATRTPPGRAPVANPRHQGKQPPPAPSPAGPGTQALTMKSEEEFLSHFGDAIDDRIAEILDELLEERNAARPHRRLPRYSARPASSCPRYSARPASSWP
jgi:hypothetical protein